jgi:hypothetical protein
MNGGSYKHQIYKFSLLLITVFVLNILFALMLFAWATRADFTNLSDNAGDRFAELLYFSITTFTTGAYGDIVPNSTRARVVVMMFLAVVFSAISSIVLLV